MHMGIGAVVGATRYNVVLILQTSGVVDWMLHWWIVEMLWFKNGDIGSLEHDLWRAGWNGGSCTVNFITNMRIRV